MVGHPEMLRRIGLPRPPGGRGIVDGATGIVSRSQSPGARRPGRWRISGASRGSRAKWLSMVAMSAPRSNTRRTRATIDGRALTQGNRIVTRTAWRAGRWPTATLPRFPSTSMPRCQTSSSIHSLPARRPGRQRRQHARPVVGRPVGQPQRHAVARWGAAPR